MSLGNGWIKLHRKIINNWIWDDPEKLRAWIDILLMVNHEDKQIPFNGHIITIHKGQKLTSLYKLAERWNWTRNRVDRFLKLLDEAGMVTADRTANGTLLTVINWAFYQDTRDTNEATSEATNEATNGATVDTQTRMNKNDKEGEEGGGYSPHPQDSPPTLSEIRAECEANGYTAVNQEKFFSYYAARNWRLGGEPINWKAMLKHWELKDKASGKKKKAALDDDFWNELREKARKEDEARAKRERDATG